MKKKQLLALALVGAMSAGTAASLVPSAVYAAEKTERQKLTEALDKHKKEVDVSKIKVKELTDAQVKELLEIFKNVEVLESKKLGDYKTEEDSIQAAFDALTEAGYGENKDIVTYRKEKLKMIDDAEGEAVKDAEKVVKEKRVAFDNVDDTDYKAKAEAAKALGEATETLDQKQKAYISKLNELAQEINNVEIYQKLKDAVDAVKDEFKKAIIDFTARRAYNSALETFKLKRKLKDKYSSLEEFKKEKEKAEKAVGDIVAKVNSQVLEDSGITADDLKNYVKNELNDSEKKILIENKLTEADIKKYEELAKELEIFGNGDQAAYSDAINVETAKSEYEAAYKAAKKAKDDLDEAMNAKKSAISRLEVVVDAGLSKMNFDKYTNNQKAAKLVNDKLDSTKAKVKEAKDNLSNAEMTLKEAKEELAKDPENEINKTNVELAQDDVNAKKEILEKAEKVEMSVKADYDKLQKASDKLFEAFKDYSKAAIKGAGKAQLEKLKEKYEKALKEYNEFGKEFGLSEITVTMNEAVESGMWFKDANGTWFYRNAKSENMYKNAWAKIDNVWYRFDENGAMLANKWFKDTNNRWYWLNASGRMAEKEWVNVDGSWFYAYGSGAIAENEWVLVNGTWYYAQNGGYIAIDKTLNINGVDYSFDGSGALK